MSIRWTVWLTTLVASLVFAPTGEAQLCYSLEEVNVTDSSGADLSTSWFGISDRNRVVGNFCLAADCSAVRVGEDDQFVGGAIYTLPRGHENDDCDDDDRDDDERDDEDRDDGCSVGSLSGGTFETFSLPAPYNWVGGVGINNRGQVAGQALIYDPVADAFVGFAAFVRDRDGTITILPEPVGGTLIYVASSINDWGQVVGFFIDPDTAQTRGFIYTRRTGRYALYDIFAPPGRLSINDVNNRFAIVGDAVDDAENRFSFILRAGATRFGRRVFTPHFFNVPGATRTWAPGISSRGLVAGYSVDSAGVATGYVYDGRDFLATGIAFGSSLDTQLSDINARRIVVGTYEGNSFGLIGQPVPCHP
ncbi:MAG: hypothetical protein ACFCGT_18545 [Sandaracinaceae bacterium]